MIRYGLVMGILLFLLLFINSCSENNFFPVKFVGGEENKEWITLDKEVIAEKWKTNYINPNETHRYSATIDSGFNYELHISTECGLTISTYLVKDQISDTLNLVKYFVGVSGVEDQLFSTYKNSKLYLSIVSESSLSNQKYSVLLKKNNLETVSADSYLDTNLLAIDNKPIKSIFNDTLCIDSVVFDNIDRKYLYAIPIDSFQMISLTTANDEKTNRKLFFHFAVLSGNSDSVLLADSTNDHYFKWTYWKDYADSLYLSVGVDYALYDLHAQLYKKYGVFDNYLPRTTISVHKKSFPPVKKDAFYDDTATMIFLNRDTLYQLSLYDELFDKFYYTINPDSIYSLSISSIGSLPLTVDLAPINNNLAQLTVTGEKEVVFKPMESSTIFRIEIKSSISYPTNYSIILDKYTGNDTTDLFEPDDDVKTASLLYQDSIYAHTIFPQNDNDLYKVYCIGNDTFNVHIDFRDSTILKAHTGFSFKSYYNFTQTEMKIHQLSCVDSASLKKYTFYREAADTAVFIAKDIETLEYSISLTR